MLQNLHLPNFSRKKWALVLSSASLICLVLHYNIVKRRNRNKVAPIDFVVDKCIKTSTTTTTTTNNGNTPSSPLSQKNLISNGNDNDNNNNNPKKIVLIHGWPDNASLWKYQIPELIKNYDCYRLILPNYDKKAKNYEGIHSWGYDLVEVANGVNECVRTRILNNNKNEKVTLLIHDWGSYVGYLAYKFDKNNLYDRIISIDVGDHTGIDGLWSGFNVMLYQWYNSFVFLLPRLLGDCLNLLFPILAQAPLIREGKSCDIHAGMNYLYFYLWWRLFTGQLREVSIKKGKIFKIPFLFIYGDKTPFKFHTKHFAQKMQEKPNGYVLLKGHTHWAMYDKKGQEFNKVLLDWLDFTDKLSLANGKEDTNDAKL